MPDYRSTALHDQLSALLREGEQILSHRHDRATAGLDAADRTDPGFRIERPSQAAGFEDEEGPDGAVTSKEGDGPTKLYIYSDIGGWFGVWPEEIVAALAGIKGDVELHLHSPGGDAFDGVAIYNALRDHPGKILGQVDGMAASAASIIAMACDQLTMKLGSQMMIHDAWGISVGPEADMIKTAQFLGKVSQATAEIYAARAGGSVAEWRQAMRDESWYTGSEAVEAKLADKVETGAQAAKNKWDLRIFQYAGRDAAPAPRFPAGKYQLGQWGTALARQAPEGQPTQPTGFVKGGPLVDLDALAQMAEREKQGKSIADPIDPAAAAEAIHQASLRANVREAIKTPDGSVPAGQSRTEGGANMPFDPKKIREALGLGPDATDAQVQEAWASAYATPSAAPTPAPTPPAAPGQTDSTSLNSLAELARQRGVVLMDPAQVDEMRQMAARGQQAYNEQRASKRDAVIDEAIRTGRVALSRRDDWIKAWDAEVATGGDGSKTKELIESLSPNLVPMEAAGYAGVAALNEADNRYYDMYPEDKPRVGGGSRG